MRDCSVSLLDPKTGLASFSLANFSTVTGINLLIAQVTKMFYSSTFTTALFTYYGLDLQSIPLYNLGENSIDVIQSMLSSKLQNIVTAIQNNTPANALPTEQLSSLSLSGLIYDEIDNRVIITIVLTPVQGDSQTLLLPLGA